MELVSRLTPGPCSECRQLKIGSEISLFFRNAVGTSGALEALPDALYKSTTTTNYYNYYTYFRFFVTTPYKIIVRYPPFKRR